jgi:hypothetical protein
MKLKNFQKKGLLLLVLFLLALPLASASSLDNVVSVWSMEESSGQLVDSHSSYDTTTANGDPTYQVPWLLNYGLDLDGTGDWFKTDAQSGFNVGTGDFSACIWINPDVDGTDLRLFGSDTYTGGSSYTGWLMWKDSTNVMTFATRNIVTGAGNSKYCSGSISVTSGNDYFVCGVRENNVLQIYVNGVNDVNCSEDAPTDIDNSVGIKIGAMDEDPGTKPFNGQIDEAMFFNNSLTQEDILLLYNGGLGLEYPFITQLNLSDSVESTSVVKQLNPVTFTSGVQTIVSANFNISNNNTKLYGGYSFNVETNGNNVLYCELYVNNTLYANVTRSNNAYKKGSVFLQTPVMGFDAGEYTQELQCRRLSGGNQITISNTVGVGHILVDEDNNTIIENDSLIDVSVSSGSSYTLIDSINVTVSNKTFDNQTGQYNHIIVEGALNYFNNDVSSETLGSYVEINGTICPYYPRDVSAGGSGSVGFDCIVHNLTANTTYQIDLYANGTNADYVGSIVAKNFYIAYDEIIGGSGILTGYKFSDNTDTLVLSVDGGNRNHALANTFVKLSYSLYSDKDTTANFWVILNNSETFQTINFTRYLSAGSTGVLIGQDVLEGVSRDNYTISLYANCGTTGANCTIRGGQSSGYLTDVVTTIFNSFNITTYNFFDDSDILSFNVTDGGFYETTTGEVQIFTTADFINFTIQSQNYQNKTVLNHNTSEDLNTSLTPDYYVGAYSYSNYVNYSGFGYTSNLSYEIQYLCPLGTTQTAYIIINNTIIDSFNPTCNNNLVNNVGSVIWDFEGYSTVFINWSGSSVVTDDFNVIWDLNRPTITQSFETGEGFNNNSINIEVTCEDTISPILTYNISWVGSLLNYSNQTSATTLNFEEVAGLENWVYTVCTDLGGNTRTNNYSQDVYSTQFVLVNEQNGSLFDVNNLSSVVVYIDDNSSSIDLKSLATNSFNFTSAGDDILRFEYIYSDGTIINRYFDMSLTDSNYTRFCAIPDGDFSFYEQIIVSSIDSTRVTLEGSFADCVVLADTTRFAYQNAFAIRTFLIDTTYILYSYVDGIKAILANIDGGIEAFINIDSLEFSSSAFNQGLRAESLNVEKYSGTTMLLVYNNTNNDNAFLEVTIIRTDTGAEVYFEDEFDNDNYLILYYDFSSLSGLTNQTLFKVVVNTIHSDGTSNSLIKFFNTNGKTGLINPKVAFLFVFLGLLLGLTFPTASDALSWFGLLICIGNMGVIASSILTEGLALLMAINGVVMIYIILILVNQTSQRVAT